MRKKRFLSILALLCLTVSGAWAQGFALNAGDAWDATTKTLTVNSNPGGGAYSFQEAIEHVIIANTVTEIGQLAFTNCSNLTSVSIPSSVTNIAMYAFYGCSLTSITIPNSVTSIGEYAFYACTGLTSIEIPNSVTSIGTGAFAACYGLTSMVVVSGNTNYDSRGNCNAIIEKSSNTLIAGCNNTIIPTSVTSIGMGAFAYFTGLTSITIPNSVTSIGDYAFQGCTALTSIEIPNSVTSIGMGAFLGCTGLETVTINAESLESYGSGAFDGTAAALKIYVPAGSVDTYKAAWAAYEDKITPPPAYTVTLKEGTEDADNWTITPEEAKTTGVAEGTEVTATYSGTKLVKSVKATKKPGPAAIVATAPTATTGDIVAGSETALVSGGTAEGGTMMYKVTTANTQPTSTEGFSADVPTAQATAITAPGTYYVWYYVKADDSHSDSEISATGIEVTIAAKAAAEVTAQDKDKLICTDGHIHEYGKDAWCTKARVALIIYIGTEGHATYKHGLALALNDVSANTLTWDNSGANNGGKTAAEWCSAWNTSKPVKDAEWLLPSKDQWNYMLNACASGTARYGALWGRFASVGGSNLQSGNYWSSTWSFDEQVWYLTTGWGRKTWNESLWVRACLAF